MATNPTPNLKPQHDKKDIAIVGGTGTAAVRSKRQPSRALSGDAERMLLRREKERSLVDLTLQPFARPEQLLPVINTPALPGVPVNIRVNDPGEDTMFGNDTTQSEPSIAVFGSNVVVGFNDSTPNASFSGLANSSDFGQVFTDDGGITPADESGDPVLVADSAGNFYYAALVANFGTQESFVGVSKSTNGGASFSAAVDASHTSGTMKTAFQDKEWLAVDSTGGPSDGNLYLSWTQFTGFDWTFGFATNSQIMFSRSTDGGTTWSQPAALSALAPGLGPSGSMPSVGPNGEVYVAWLGRDDSTIDIRRSDDNGQNFANPVAGGGAVANITQIPDTLNGSIRADSFVSIATDQNSGDVYIVYTASRAGDDADVYLVKSSDQGQHWTAPLKVNDDATTTDQWMPSVAVSATGAVGVMFYDRRNDSAHNLNMDVYLAVSTDGGATFLPNQRITTATFPPAVNFDPRIAGNYMGDYNQMVAQGTRFYMVWGDNRDIVGTRNDPNVYFATVGTEDCYVRDNPSDDGSVPDTGLLYISPDIAPAMNPSVFGTPNPVTITVHNMGQQDATNVVVSLFWADPATSIPSSAWHSNRITVLGVPTNQQIIPTIPAVGSANAPQPFVWNPPNPSWATYQGHFCLLAQINSAADPITFPGGGWDAVARDNNLAVRNVHVANAGGHKPLPIHFLVAGDLKEEWIANLEFDGRALPLGVQATLTLPETILKGAKYEGLKVIHRHSDEGYEPNGAKLHEDAQLEHEFQRGNVTLEFTPGRAARILGVKLQPHTRHLAELVVHAGKDTPRREVPFNIQQTVDGHSVGGLLYLLNFGKAKTAEA